MTNQLIPKLRFKQFHDNYNKSRLINITNHIDYRGKTPKKSDKGIRLITASNIKQGYIDYKADKKYINKYDYFKVMHRGLPNIGDVLITTEAPLGNVAQVDNNNIALAQRVIKYRGKSNILNNDYLSRVFLSNSFKKNLYSKATGGTVKGIKGNTLHKISIYYPTLSEQQKIGTFFAKLDYMIELQAKKLSHLKKLKKGYLQKMFPQKGDSVPRLRFNGFHDEWNKKKIMNILNYEQPTKYIVKNDKYLNKGMPVLTANQSFVLGYTNESNVYNKNNCIIFDDFTENFKYVDFAFKVKSSALKILTAKNSYNIYFIYNLLQTTHLIYEGHSRHYISNVQNHKINIPSIKEQNQIGQFFKHLDQSIIQQKNKLSQLKQLKKGYLQKMFI